MMVMMIAKTPSLKALSRSFPMPLPFDLSGPSRSS